MATWEKVLQSQSMSYMPIKSVKNVAREPISLETPIGEEDVDSNLGAIAVVEHHLTVGISKHWNKHLTSTLSYMRGFHNEVESSLTPNKIEAEQNIAFFQFSFRM